MVQKAQKKPIVVEVCQWTGDNLDEIKQFCGEKNIRWGRQVPITDLIAKEITPWDLYIETLEGLHKALIGDYIIKGVKGEFYPCKKEIFHKTYSLLE